MQQFALHFAAVDAGNEVGCGDTIGGLGPVGADSIELSDLRFYVSNVRFTTTDGDSVAAELDANEFQYVDADGSVALVDLTGTTTGACSGDGITFPEGTARTHSEVTGSVRADAITGVSFDIAIPQRLMKNVIANNTAEDAPSPLAEMHWSWGFAYRFFVMNVVVDDDDGDPGEGYLHVGSTDCGGDGNKALTDRDSCGNINAAAVSLSPFDPASDTIAVDLRALVAGLDFEVATEEQTVLGLECHSAPSQPDCPTVFANLGIDFSSGGSNAALNEVFSVR
jgi:uncharacterized repeat protein (TIGR04052 family)